MVYIENFYEIRRTSRNKHSALQDSVYLNVKVLPIFIYSLGRIVYVTMYSKIGNNLSSYLVPVLLYNFRRLSKKYHGKNMLPYFFATKTQNK